MLTPAQKFINENYRKSGASRLAQHWQPIYPEIAQVQAIRRELVHVDGQKSNHDALDQLKDLFWQ